MKTGVKGSVNRKKQPQEIAVRPVRPPAAAKHHNMHPAAKERLCGEGTATERGRRGSGEGGGATEDPGEALSEDDAGRAAHEGGQDAAHTCTRGHKSMKRHTLFLC